MTSPARVPVEIDLSRSEYCFGEKWIIRYPVPWAWAFGAREKYHVLNGSAANDVGWQPQMLIGGNGSNLARHAKTFVRPTRPVLESLRDVSIRVEMTHALPRFCDPDALDQQYGDQCAGYANP